MTDADTTLAALDHDPGITLGDVPLPGPWAERGRCRTAPTNLFFPTRGSDTTQAKAVCAGCPVIDQCRAYGLAHAALVGIWGGLTGRERRNLRGLAEPIEIETPPPAVVERGGPRRQNKGPLYRTLEALAEHPERWARIGAWPQPETAGVVASLCRTGRRRIPPGTWTFEPRRTADGSELYARLDHQATEASA